MQAVIAIIGMLIVVEGILFMINPMLMRKFIDFFLQGKLIYIAGVVRVVLAVIFLVFANQCVHSWIIIIFGVAFLIGAIFIFAVNIDKLKNMLRWWKLQKDYLIRSVGLIASVLGLLIVYGAIIQWP